MTSRTIAKIGLLLVAASLGVVLGNSVVGKARPKARLAAKRAVRQAATPTYEIPVSPNAQASMEQWQADAENERYAYKGTRMAPPTQPLHETLAAEFSRIDPFPPQRRARFGYLLNMKQGVTFTGWHGSILSANQTPDGIVVKVRFTPGIAAPNAGVLSTTDYWIETYHYSPATKTLTFVGSEEPPVTHIKALMSD